MAVPYSRNPEDLFHPGRANNFFDPSFGATPSDAALCSEMARLAYVRHEDGGGEARLKGFLDRAQFQLGARFNTSGTQGFVASRAGVTVIAFRGTEPGESADLRSDSRFWPSRWEGGGRVHTGFREALDLVREQFLAAVREAPGRLLLTGHSLGAALAVLAAGLIPEGRRGETAVYTFGCPRVGDADFAATLRDVRHARYAGACDLVSWVPPRSILPYVHHGTLFCIDRDGRTHELGSGERGHEDAAPLRQACHVEASALFEVFGRLIRREIPVDQLSDHAPINYTSAVWGLR